jgi:hypothetical protein
MRIMGALEGVLQSNAKHLRDQKGQLKRWVVFTLFQRNDGCNC